MDLSNLDLLELQTKAMKQDITTQAMCAAINPQLLKLAQENILASIYSRIDELEDDVLDILAWQFNCSWYDSSASVDIKRQLIKTALVVHKTRGTAYAVEEVVKSYFGSGEVKEWFNYGGAPYAFKVIIHNERVSTDLQAQFMMALNAVKNVRSYLDELVIGNTCSDHLFCSDSLIII